MGWRVLFWILVLSLGIRAQVISVNDYGARPDQPEDAGPALRQALEAAISLGEGAVLTLSPGTYWIGGEPGSSHHLRLERAHRLTIEGNGAELIFTNPKAGAILIWQSQGVIIRNLTIDYSPLPYSQGKITSVKPGSVEYQVDPGYPGLSELGVRPSSGFGSLFNPWTGLLKETAPDHFRLSSWELLGPGLYSLTPQGNQAPFQVGDAFVYVARQGGGGVDVMASGGVHLENLSIYAAPTQAVTIWRSSEVVIRGLHVACRPGTDRLISTNSDGVHAQQNRVGPTITDSYFQGMLDDGVNIYSLPNIVTGVTSETEILISPHRTPHGMMFTEMEEGDLLEVWDPITGQILGLSRIVSLRPQEGSYEVVFEDPIFGMVAGRDYTNATHIYNRSASGEGFLIQNNTFEGHRRYGIFIKSGNGVIQGNTLRNLSGTGIIVANEPDWPEGPTAANILIKDNLIEYVGYPGSASRSTAAIQIRTNSLGFSLALGYGQRQITVENNTIRDWPLVGIYVGSAQDVFLINNTLEMTGERDSLRPGNATGVLLENVKGVVIDGLRIEDHRPIRAGVLIQDSALDLSLTGLWAELPLGVPHVLDLR